MSDLEKLFLGTIMVTGLLIFGLFGLYFDVGDMVAATFADARPTYAQDMDLIRERRRASYERQTQVKRASKPLSSTPAERPSGPANYARLIIRRPPPSKGEMIDREIRRLQRRGYIDDEYLRMRATYQTDKSLIPIIDQYDQLVAAGDYAEAIRILTEAQRDIDDANLLAKKDIVAYLYQAYILGGMDREANQALSELADIKERIVEIEERAEQHRDSSGRKYVKDLRKGLGQLRESITAMDSSPEYSKMMQTMVKSAMKGEKIVVPSSKVAQNIKAQILNNPKFSRQDYQFMLDKVQSDDSIGP